MNVLEFRATIIKTSEENNILILGFLENDQYDNYIIFQHQLSPLSKEDIELGFTSYYLEVSPYGKGGYNLISKLDLSASKIEIILNDKGVEELDFSKILIHFNDKKFRNLIKPKMEIIFKNEDFFNIAEV